MNIQEKLASIRAKVAAEKEEALKQQQTNIERQKENEQITGLDPRILDIAPNNSNTSSNHSGTESSNSVSSISANNLAISALEAQKQIVVATELPNLFTAAASQTTDIDHLEFLSKMNALQSAIHTQHPTLPVLLFQIHEQLKKDPEIVTLLNEDAIGVIVHGLEIQTKTELVSVVVKQSKAKDKKIPVTLDML